MVEHGCHIAQGQWLPQEAKLSSTWRELRAVLKVLQSLTIKLCNQRIRWFTDNQNVVRILSVGSKNPLLQQEVIAIFNNSITNQVRIEPEWIPREANQQADFISRIVDSDDWSLHPDLFAKLDAKWGPHTVDRFASYFNTQLPRFNSRFWNPGSEAVDTLVVSTSIFSTEGITARTGNSCRRYLGCPQVALGPCFSLAKTRDYRV